MVEQTKVYTDQELQEQMDFAIQIFQTGTPDELEKMREAYEDPDLHPQIKKVILLAKARAQGSTPINNRNGGRRKGPMPINNA